MYKTTEDKSKHYEECSHCGYKTEEGGHTFTASVIEDKTKHQETCTLCGYKKDAAAHSYGEWVIDEDSTEDEQGKKHRTCSVCNYTEYGVIEPKEHTQHVWKTEYSSNAQKHWHDCVKNPKCTAKNEEADHTLVYVKDEADGHYQKCSACGYTTEKTSHNMKYVGVDNSSAHYQECETCGYTTKETAHAYDIPNHDEKNHWKECVCGKHDTESAHTYTSGTVIKDGKAVEICSECKYENPVEGATIVVKDEKSLAEAANAEGVATVKYGDAIEITKNIALKRTVTIDMDSKTMTIDGGSFSAGKDVVLTVKNIPQTMTGVTIDGLDIIVAKESENAYVYYPTLKAAVDAAGTKDVVMLQNNVTLTPDDKFTVKKAVNLVLYKNVLEGEENITLGSGGSIAVYVPAETQGELAFTGAVAKNTTTDEQSSWDTYYPTLPDAIKAAASGAALKLLDDVTLRYTTGIEKTLTLDLNGKKITKTGSSYPLKVKGSGVTLTITGDGTISANDGAVWVFDEAKVVIENGTYSGKYAIEVGKYDRKDSSASSGGHVEIEGGTFTSTENTVHVWENSSAKISGGTFTATDNAVIGTDGSEGLKNCSYTIDITGGTFNGNTAKEGYIACGIYLANTGTVNLSGGTFNITGGVGVLVRSGTLNATGGTINLTEKDGLTSGKVGNADVAVKTGSEIVVDTKAKYPGATPQVTNSASFTVKDTDGNSYTN